MGRPPRCNPCCRSYRPATKSFFAAAGVEWDDTAFSLKLDEYTPATLSWSARADMNSPGSGLQTMGHYNTTAFAFGRDSSQDRTDGYSRDSDTWSTLTSSPITCANSGVASVGATSYVVDTNYNPISNPSGGIEQESYSATGDNWTSLAGVAVQEVNQALATDMTTNYLVGGLNTAAKSISTVRAYSISGDSWSVKSSMPSPARTFVGLFPSGDGATVTAAYGETFATSPSFSVKNDTDQYSIAGDSWTTKTSAPTPARSRGAWGTIAGRGYFAMGTTTTTNDVSDTDSYTIATDTWTGETSIAAARDRERCGGTAV